MIWSDCRSLFLWSWSESDRKFQITIFPISREKFGKIHNDFLQISNFFKKLLVKKILLRTYVWKVCLANFLKISYVIQTHVFRKLSDLMIEWSEITIWLAITFLWCSRSWSWSDLRSLFEQVILIWSQITFRVILQFFAYLFRQDVNRVSP